MSTVHIIIATYQGEKYISEQIESILANTYQDFEISICDDGSRDQTLSIVRGYEQKYPDKIRVYQNEKNLGVCANFLHAIQFSDAPYTMFCDQDDYWKEDKIAKTLEIMKDVTKQAGAIPITVFTDAVVVDSNKKELASSFHKSNKLNTNHLDLPHLLMENKLIGCTIMFNQKAKQLLTVMPRHVKMHDWWIALVCAAFGRVAYLPEGTLLYRQHGNNVIGDQSFLTYVKNRIFTLGKQRGALIRTMEQAQEFYDIYYEQLDSKAKEQIAAFAGLGKQNWIKKRTQIMKYGFWKTGIIRNIGVLLVI